MKIVGIVQARMSSKRLPGKVMREIASQPAIWWTLSRASRAVELNELWLVCSELVADGPLAAYVTELGFPVFRGSEDDVLSRYAAVARQTGADVVVRLTGDCPIVDPAVIDLVIKRFLETGVDYAALHPIRTFPDGLDVEVFTSAALGRADREAIDPFLRQHVTPYIHGRLKDRLPWGGFTTECVTAGQDFSHLRWTLDEPEDLAFLRKLVPMLPENFCWMDVVAAVTRDPELLLMNRRHGINAGAAQDLRKLNATAPRFDRSNQHFARALETIPLASQTFSKSYQQWVRGATPLFLDRGAGCRVVDLDSNIYIDYLQGLMANVLGHGDPDVDAAIRDQLDRGMSFPLATPREAELAELLVRIIPCAEMARFGKSGSDATSGAIRLARAHTGRHKVAICGYHGWHDWYIGTTTRHLGVPPAVRELSATFSYNDPDSLAALLRAEPSAFAAVILEAGGSRPPEEGFLERVRELCDQYGVLLVFDEIITGFRLAIGGAQQRYGVMPDLAAFGKAMANGMPISAVVGRAEVMKGMEDIFFSGTFGGEALSIAAAIATIQKLEREDVPRRLDARGADLIEKSNALFVGHGLGSILGFVNEGWWPRLAINAEPTGLDPNLVTSLFRQETVAHGLLLASSYNLCLAHDTDPVMEETLKAMDAAAGAFAVHLNAPDPAACLRGDMVRPTFSVR